MQLVGLVDGRLCERFESFAGTSSMNRLARDVDVHGVNLFARKPGPSASQ